MTRQEKVTEIYKIGKKNKLNVTTLVFLVAMTSDKGVTKLLNDLNKKYGKGS